MYAKLIWRFLMEHNVSLTKDVLETAVDDLGFVVSPISASMSLMVKLKINYETLLLDGYSFVGPEGDKHIVYKDDLPRDRSNYVILHEIGHFVINRSFGGAFGDKKENTEQKEREANQFVYEYYPSPVLYEAGIRSAEQIEKFTQLDWQSVQMIYNRVQYYANGKPYTKEEKEICSFYQDFIEEYKAENQIVEETEEDTEQEVSKDDFPEVEYQPAQEIQEDQSYSKPSTDYHYWWFFAVSAAFLLVIATLILYLDLNQEPTAIYNPGNTTGVTTQGAAAITVAATTEPPTQPITTTETAAPPTTAPTTTTKALQTKLAPGTLVYVTKEGDRYHLPGCYHIRGKENLIEMTVEQAETAGYESCKYCVE